MLDWLDQNLQDSDVLFDVGANIGLYSLYAARLKPRARIYSFEPESQNFSRLCRNITLNQANNIVPCCFPLADEERFDYFYVSEMIEGGAEHSFGEFSALLADPSKIALKQGTLSSTLDALVEKYGVPPPTLLKIDVDGLEEKILKGAQRVLRSPALRGLIIEFNLPQGAGEPPQVAWLKSYGLELAGRSQWVYRSADKMQSQNFIFTRVPADRMAAHA
jgi:FkbM family methyltransferase